MAERKEYFDKQAKKDNIPDVPEKPIKIKAVIFDFGGVLMKLIENLSLWQEGFAVLGATVDINTATKKIINEYCTGQYSSEETFLKDLAEALKIPDNITNNQIIAAWNAQIIGMNPELYKLMEYRKRFLLFGLSNTNKLHADYFEFILYPNYQKEHSDKSLPSKFRDLFIKVYCSHEIFHRKPDLAAWQKILDDNPQFSPEEFLYIDDVKEYVDAAKSLGMSAFCFDMKKHSLDDAIRFIDSILINVDEFEKYASLSDLEKLSEILKSKEMPFLCVDKLNAFQTKGPTQSLDVKNTKPTTKTKKLFEDEFCQILFEQTKGYPAYFILTPKSKQCDSFYALRVMPFLKFLRKKGYPSYTLSQNIESQAYYIVPSLNRGKRTDINAKIINSLRCFFGGSSLVHFDRLPNLKHYEAISENTDSMKYPKEYIWDNIDKLEDNTFQSLIHFLREHNILKIPEHLNTQNSKIKPPPKQLQRKSRSCEFCDPVIIAKQLIIELRGFLILVNYKPYAGSMVHVMVVPAHVEDWHDLTDEQAHSLSIIQNAVVNSLQANFGFRENQLITMIQNGVCAGQTVAGIHLHILNRPKELPMFIEIMYEMIGKQNLTLTKQKMSEMGERIKPEMVQYLLSQSPPNKFSVSTSNLITFSYKRNPFPLSKKEVPYHEKYEIQPDPFHIQEQNVPNLMLSYAY